MNCLSPHSPKYDKQRVRPRAQSTDIRRKQVNDKDKESKWCGRAFAWILPLISASRPRVLSLRTGLTLSDEPAERQCLASPRLVLMPSFNSNASIVAGRRRKTREQVDVNKDIKVTVNWEFLSLMGARKAQLHVQQVKMTRACVKSVAFQLIDSGLC